MHLWAVHYYAETISYSLPSANSLKKAGSSAILSITWRSARYDLPAQNLNYKVYHNNMYEIMAHRKAYASGSENNRSKS